MGVARQRFGRVSSGSTMRGEPPRELLEFENAGEPLKRLMEISERTKRLVISHAVLTDNPASYLAAAHESTYMSGIEFGLGIFKNNPVLAQQLYDECVGEDKVTRETHAALVEFIASGKVSEGDEDEADRERGSSGTAESKDGTAPEAARGANLERSGHRNTN